ncbi:MAG TPA: hypothetical protein VGN24_01465 [Rhodanobacter sp.]|nr:hypothetical protein [Rhodanobacter sp.]
MQLALQNVDELGKRVRVRWNVRPWFHRDELHLEPARYGNVFHEHPDGKAGRLPLQIGAAGRKEFTLLQLFHHFTRGAQNA